MPTQFKEVGVFVLKFGSEHFFPSLLDAIENSLAVHLCHFLRRAILRAKLQSIGVDVWHLNPKIIANELGPWDPDPARTLCTRPVLPVDWYPVCPSLSETADEIRIRGLSFEVVEGLVRLHIAITAKS
ncbi:hypothetical protein PsAD46_01032 [Pseudovibrio sp. Ad46]|nr:hypothetical protein PsAD46_01032 [Pseudovibrio sp. Ad46]